MYQGTRNSTTSSSSREKVLSVCLDASSCPFSSSPFKSATKAFGTRNRNWTVRQWRSLFYGNSIVVLFPSNFLLGTLLPFPREPTTHRHPLTRQEVNQTSTDLSLVSRAMNVDFPSTYHDSPPPPPPRRLFTIISKSANQPCNYLRFLNSQRTAAAVATEMANHHHFVCWNSQTLRRVCFQIKSTAVDRDRPE